MKREYTYWTFNFELERASSIQKDLNEMGDQGWRVISHQIDSHRFIHVLLERTEEEARAAKFLADAIEQGIITGAKP